MTISSTARKAGPFSGTGAQNAYPFNFKVFAASDVLVVQTDGAGIEHQLGLTAYYAVALNADQDANPGGTVNLLTALPAGHLLTISSAVSTTQGASIPNMGGFYPKVIEQALDRLTIIAQQTMETAKRGLQFAFSDTNTTATLPTASARGGKFLGFDASGNPVAASGTGADAGLRTDLASVLSGASLVAFVHRGVGAVLRSALDKLRDRVNVMDYMSDAQRTDVRNRTASVDVTDAFNAAIASVNPGGLVRLPPAPCYVNGKILLKNKVSLRGDGKASSELWLGPNGGIDLSGTADAKVGYLTIEDMGITNQGGGPEYGLNMQYVFAVLVKNCVIYNCSVGVSGFNYVTFDRCEMYTGQLYADHPAVNQISEALKVSKCKGSSYKILVKDTADVMIDHTHLLGSASQINISRGEQNAAFYPPVWIDHTVVDSGDDEGILLNGVSPHIDNCFVSCGRTNGKNSIVLTDCTEGSITNNMVRFSGKNALFMRLCSDITISGNALNDNQLYAVSIGDSNNLRFIANAMTNAPAWYGGSYVQQTGLADEPGNCTNITVVYNQLGGNAVGPLYLPGATHTIHSNQGFDTNIFPGAVMRAAADNVASIGTADFRCSTIYAATSAIATSDERAKQQRVGGIDPAVLRAWGRVQYAQFKFVDAVTKKGEDGARWHIGVIAQRVKEAFEAEGLDAFGYGLLCYDDWGTGNRYGIRYEEALALECAYLRSRLVPN